MKQRKAFKSLLARNRYIIAPGAFDTLTARLVQVAGFEAVYLTGGGYSRANGYPDLGLLTLPEVVRWIGLTVEATDIPVIADADTGYGNALNVVRTVREFEKAGAAAFHMEDQLSPKKCGHYEGKQVITVEEMVGKIKAAVDTRQDSDLVIIARSDARAVEGLDAAIERVNRYLEAGADMGFVEACRRPNSSAWVSASAYIHRRRIAPRSSQSRRRSRSSRPTGTPTASRTGSRRSRTGKRRSTPSAGALSNPNISKTSEQQQKETAHGLHLSRSRYGERSHPR
jgi:isocitrate lyase